MQPPDEVKHNIPAQPMEQIPQTVPADHRVPKPHREPLTIEPLTKPVTQIEPAGTAAQVDLVAQKKIKDRTTYLHIFGRRELPEDTFKESLGELIEKIPLQTLKLAAIYKEQFSEAEYIDNRADIASLYFALIHTKQEANPLFDSCKKIISNSHFTLKRFLSFPENVDNLAATMALIREILFSKVADVTADRSKLLARLDQSGMVNELSQAEINGLIDEMISKSKFLNSDLPEIMRLISRGPLKKPLKIEIDEEKLRFGAMAHVYRIPRKEAEVDAILGIVSQAGTVYDSKTQNLIAGPDKAKEQFQEDLNFKSFALFAGDSFIKGMKEEGRDIEGASASAGIHFVASGLRYFLSAKKENLVPKEIDQLTHAAKKLEEAEKMALQFESGQKNDSIVLLYTSLINTKGDSILIPIGWRDDKGGHAVLLEVRLSLDKKNLECLLINTGDGMRYHPHSKSFRDGDTIKSYQIPLENVTREFCEHLLEPQLEGGQKRGIETKNYSSIDLYGYLKKYEKPIEGYTHKWMKLQMSGTCQTRAALAYLFSSLGNETYDSYKRFIKHEGVIGLIEKEGPSLAQHANTVRVLGFTFQDLYRHFIKELNAGHSTSAKELEWIERLSALTQAGVQLQKFAAQENQIPPLENISVQPLPQMDVNPTFSLFETHHALTPSITALSNFSGMTSIEDIVKVLNTNTATTPLEQETLNELFVFSRSKQFQTLIDNASNSQVKNLMMHIQLRSGSIYNAMVNQTLPDPNAYAALASGMEVILTTIDLLEKKTGVPAELKLTIVRESIKSLNEEATLLSSELLTQRYQMSKKTEESQTTPLFSFKDYPQQSSTDEVYHLSIPLNECVFINKYMTVYTPQLAQELEQQFEQVQQGMKQPIQKEQWKAMQAFTQKKLPYPFYILFNMARMLRMAAPGTIHKPQAFSSYIGEMKLTSDLSNQKLFPFFTLNKTDKWGWNEELLQDPQAYQFHIQKHDYHPTIAPSDSGELDFLQQNYALEKQKGNLLSKPTRVTISVENKYFSYFDAAVANLLHHYGDPGSLIEDPFSRTALFLDMLAKMGDNYYAPEFQALLVENLATLGPITCAAIEKSPQNTFELFKEFFRTRTEEIESVLVENPFNRSYLRAYSQLCEWQIKIHNLFRASELPQHNFKKDIAAKLVFLANNSLVQKDINYKKYDLQLELLAKEFAEGPEDLIRFIATAIQYKDASIAEERYTISSPYLEHIINGLIAKHTLVVVQFLQTASPNSSLVQTIIATLLKKEGKASDKPLTWSFQNGLLSFRYNGETFVYDLVHHQLFVNGKVTKTLNTKTPAFQMAFNGRPLSDIRTDQTVIFAKDGPAFVAFSEASPHLIHKKIDAPPFGMTGPMVCELLFNGKEGIPDLFPAVAWNFETDEDKGIAYIDPDTGKIVALINSAQEILLDEYPNKKFELRESPLKQFSKESVLLVEKHSSGPPIALLSLPRFKGLAGKSLSFTLKEGKWLDRNNPKQWLAFDQTLTSGLKNGLILETDTGSKNAVFPLRPIGTGHPDIDRTLLGAQPETVTLITCPLSADGPKPPTLRDRLFLAYSALQQATLPEHYEKALHYLHEGVRFGPLTPEEYKVLGWIVLSDNEKKDHSVHAAMVRLYALWIIEDNQTHWGFSPVKITFKENAFPNFNSAADQFVSFLNAPVHLSRLRESFIEEYLAKRNNLPSHLHIDNLLSDAELKKWSHLLQKPSLFYEQIPVPQLIDPSSLVQLKTIPNYEILLRHMNQATAAPIQEMHPTTERLCASYRSLLESAISTDSQKRTIVAEQLQLMIGDTNPVNTLLRLILYEQLQSPGIPSSFYSLLMSSQPQTTQEEFKNGVEHFLQQRTIIPPSAVGTAGPAPRPGRPSVDPTLPSPLDFIEHASFNQTTSLSRLNQLYVEHYHMKRPTIEKNVERLEVSTTDPFIQKEIDSLNEDLVIGAQKNNALPVHSFRGNTAELKIEVEDAYYSSQWETERLKEKVLALANPAPGSQSESVRREALKQLGERLPLTIDDLKILFLHGDAEHYKKATGLKAEQAEQLDHLIGQYLIMSRRAQHMKHILSDLETQNLSGAGEKLRMVQAYNPSTQTRAIMVFEEQLGLYLRKDQVAALEKLLPKGDKTESVLLQKIQGGGKSLVFGHLLALLKADGEHLSVHVAPTPQYPTAIQDMYRISNRLFKQKERVIEFKESGEDPTAHLNLIYHTLTSAIRNREYVTVTKETLLSLRDKYIKSLETGARSAQESHIQFYLKSILSLFKERAIFTFDEAHLAFDPNKELNMPSGSASSIHPKEAYLVKEIVQLSQNTPIELISGKLLTNKQIQSLLGITNTQQLTEVQNYLKGESKELPPFLLKLRTEGSKAANWVEMTRQILLKDLLKNAMHKGINEEHGFPLNPLQTQVSVPYIANMKPSPGSEFSDTLIMMLNTYILYAQEGIQPEQTGQFIAYLREKAIREFNEHRYKAPDIQLDITSMPTYKKGIDLLGENFRSIDTNDAVLMRLMHTKLIANKKIWAADFLDFARDKVLPQVPLFHNQISANGQNAASMCKSFVAYTASMENSQMAPVGTRIEPDVGTNGQTIDLYLKKKMESKAIAGNARAILNEIRNKPEFKAVIDAGCHFRGIASEEVARMLLDQLAPPLKGVLYFDTNGNLNVMKRGATPLTLSGTSRDRIAEETGLTMEELFTYYDQDHITGIDIAQAPAAKALLTVGEKTELHELLQGGRRFRELDKDQTLQFAFPREIESAIRLKIGLPEGQAIGTKELLSYAAINEIEKKKSQNLLFCLQKLENSLQDVVLQRNYKGDDQNATFKAARDLFVKSIAVDFVRSYAGLKEHIPIERFLKLYAEHLLSKTNGTLSKDQIEEWRTGAARIIENAKPGLPDTIEVNKEFSTDPYLPSELHQNSTQVREIHVEIERVEERNQTKAPEAISEATDIKRDLEDANFLSKITPFDPNNYNSNDYLYGGSLNPPNWRVNELMAHERPGSYKGLFDAELAVCSSLVKTFKDHPDFIHNPKYTNVYVAAKLEDTWRIIAYSAADAVGVINEFKIYGPTPVPTFLLRPNGKLLASKSGQQQLHPPEVHTQLVQLMFARGDLLSMEDPVLYRVFEAWSSDPARKAMVKEFFVNEIKGKRPGIERSRAYRLLTHEDG